MFLYAFQIYRNKSAYQLTKYILLHIVSLEFYMNVIHYK